MAAETCAGISHQRLVALVLRRRGCQRLSPFANCGQYRPRRFSPGRKSPRLRGPCLRHPASHLNAHGARPARLSTRHSLRGLLRSRAGLLSWRNIPYDQRVDQLLMRLAQFGQKKPAPARSWPESRARLVTLDFSPPTVSPLAPPINFATLPVRAFARQCKGPHSYRVPGSSHCDPDELDIMHQRCANSRAG